MDKIITFIKNNWILAVLIVVGLFAVLMPKTVKKLFATPRRRRVIKTATRIRTRSTKRIPRSVGTRKASGKGYPAVGGGYIPYKYNKDGTIKKAWQVGGTVAAKSRMRNLRKKR